jgi:ubiquinone biosynthesis protein
MLNQVYVFGYFHADLHPANLFILPGDAIGYVDFGIVGQLPDRVRDSLTRYSWLLFRGEVESAVLELMRWLAPGPSTDIGTTRRQLIRVHQAFLYDTVADKLRTTAEAPGPARHAENPYSKLAVDILDTIRVQQLTMSASIVGYLKMLVTLGTLRHSLAVEYDLQENVRRFVRRLARQQGMALLDPRRTFDRLYAGTGRIQRSLEFLEFVEAQEPVITEATTMLFGYRNRIRRVKQRLIGFGTAVLVVGGLLYLVLVFPDDTRRIMPPEVDYTWFQLGLLAILLVLIVNLIRNMRSMGGPGD